MDSGDTLFLQSVVRVGLVGFARAVDAEPSQHLGEAGCHGPLSGSAPGSLDMGH